MYRNVVTAYDGSDGATAALAQAVDIVSASGGALTLAWSVAEPPAVQGLPTRSQDPRRAADVRHALDTVVAEIDPGIGASPWVVSGPAAPAVLAVARDIEADLIVTGSRGRGRIARAVLGSVSSELVHNSSCDVLVVHPRGSSAT